ncbi:MAG: serine/threonine protein kinase [Lachnospiraceae bacterium]|nr:serine/threonine protein kinase [Lachnospiraceae bacterium]
MNITAIIVAMSVPSAFTGFCFWMLERRIADKQREQDRKDEARRQNEIIVIEGVNAAIALGEATARAVERIPDAHCNGDMHRALEYAEKIKHKHKDFMTEQGVESIY